MSQAKMCFGFKNETSNSTNPLVPFLMKYGSMYMIQTKNKEWMYASFQIRRRTQQRESPHIPLPPETNTMDFVLEIPYSNDTTDSLYNSLLCERDSYLVETHNCPLRLSNYLYPLDGSVNEILFDDSFTIKPYIPQTVAYTTSSEDIKYAINTNEKYRPVFETDDAIMVSKSTFGGDALDYQFKTESIFIKTIEYNDNGSFKQQIIREVIYKLSFIREDGEEVDLDKLQSFFDNKYTFKIKRDVDNDNEISFGLYNVKDLIDLLYYQRNEISSDKEEYTHVPLYSVFRIEFIGVDYIVYAELFDAGSNAVIEEDLVLNKESDGIFSPDGDTEEPTLFDNELIVAIVKN